VLLVAHRVALQSVSAECIGKVELRRFRMCTVNAERFRVEGIRELELFQVDVNIADMTNGVRQLEGIIKIAVQRSGFSIVPQGFRGATEIAVNLSQCGERPRQQQVIFIYAGEPHRFKQISLGVVSTMRKPGLAGTRQQRFDFVLHAAKVNTIDVTAFGPPTPLTKGYVVVVELKGSCRKQSSRAECYSHPPESEKAWQRKS